MTRCRCLTIHDLILSVRGAGGRRDSAGGRQVLGAGDDRGRLPQPRQPRLDVQVWPWMKFVQMFSFTPSATSPGAPRPRSATSSPSCSWTRRSRSARLICIIQYYYDHCLGPRAQPEQLHQGGRGRGGGGDSHCGQADSQVRNVTSPRQCSC